MNRYLIVLVLFAALLITCSKKQEPEDVLFKVGDKYVTVKEFRIRGEFTPHPNFSRHDRNLEKILLNNLIMEKIIAKERGKSSKLADSERFQDYIKGITEQSMREELFYKVAFNTVQIDSAELKKRFVLSQREYDLEFYTIYNDSIAQNLDKRLKENPGKSVEIFNEIWDGGERPQWQVKWKDPDHINIHEALYSGPLAQDSVIGPIPLEANQWIILKVVNWRDHLLFGGEEQLQRWNEVVEKTTMNKASQKWYKYIRGVMRGKQIEFDKDTFLKLARLTRQLESADDEQAQSDVMHRFWQEEDSTLTIDDLPTEEAFLQRPFFTIDGVTWTVGDFRKAVASHPLVYRPNTSGQLDFYTQFKMAIADLVRDHYLNKEAYKMGLDKDSKVLHTKEMWRDALIAAYERDQIVKELASAFPDTSDPYRQSKLQKAVTTYMADLQQKYIDEIQVDLQKFNSLELPKIQLFVQKVAAPFPIAAPGWPVFSTDNTIEYQPLEK